MIRLRLPTAWGFALALAFLCAGLTTGCGSGGDGGQAVQTKEMDGHLKEMSTSYGKYYAEKYGGAAKKKAPTRGR
jgi:hypothetical protein